MWPFTRGVFALCGECYGMRTYINNRVITMFGDETGPCSRVFAVGNVGLSICQVVSVPTFGTVVLDMLVQKVEAYEGDGWSLGSLQGWFSGAARPVSQSNVRSMWWVTLEISLFRRVALPLWPRVVGPL
jgi:hypothetical protein